jgi:hypothetical protein
MEIELGKVDVYGNGKKSCRLTIDIKLSGRKFGKVLTISASIGNHMSTDIIQGGQMYDTLQELFPNNKRIQRLVEIWKEYHLNDMNAGTPKQTEALKGLQHNAQNYRATCKYLESINLLFDTDIKNLKLNSTKDLSEGYEYGTGWVFKDIPQNIINEIEDFQTNGFSI